MTPSSRRPRQSKGDVLILGGGVAGLACAMGLRGTGLQITLVEQQPVLGGRARSWVDSATGDRIDIGPHILLSEYPNLLSLLDMLGTRDRVVWHSDELITLAGQNGLTPMRLHRLPPPLHVLPAMLKSRDVRLRDKLSNARAVWLAMQLDEAELLRLDDVPASEMLKRLRVSQRFVDWFWRSAAMSLMNVPLEQCSSAALMRFFAHLIGHNDYRFGFPACGLDELFLPAAPRAMAQEGWRVWLNSTATQLVHSGDTCTGVILGDGSVLQARYCVAALPPAELRGVLPTEWLRAPGLRDIGRFQPSPYVSVYQWFDRKVTSRRFWTRVWSETNLNYDFYDLSNIRPGWRERPSLIASNIVHSFNVHASSDEEIANATLRELSEFVPEAGRARLVHRQVHRIPMAIPAPHPGTESARPDTSTPFERLLLAGDWTRTQIPASMESAARSGFLAAEKIRADIGKPSSLAKLPRETEGFAGWVRRSAERRRRAN
jgi:zeta-carotene desaturase